MSQLTESETLRAALFVPCATKEALHTWISIYLGLNLPDTIVDPESNSSPMDMVWEIYRKALENDDPDFSRVMVYASRDSIKTLGAAIFEVLMVLHGDRDVAHMAAIKPQAQKAQKYVKDFFLLPYLRDFRWSANTERIEIVSYEEPATKKRFTQGEYEKMSPTEQAGLIRHARYIAIVICTMTGANCVDPATRVTLADGSYAMASDVRAGDKVRSFHVGERRFVETTVKDVGLVRKKRMRLTFDDGGALVLSEDHAVLTRRGWRHARALRLGEACFSASDEAGSRTWSHEVDLDHRAPVNDPFQVLLGTLLGDASLVWPRNRSGEKYGQGPRFQLFHCDAQRDYLEEKLEILRPLIGDCRVYSQRGGMKAVSKTLPSFAPLYEELYPNNKKTLSRELLTQLTLEGLAYWLMDDGSGGATEVGSRKDKHLSLATCRFDEEQHRLILDRLQELGFPGTMGAVRNSKKSYPIVEWSLAESRKLSAALDRYVQPSVKYKFPTPEGFLASRCIDCGAPTLISDNPGFSRCVRHPYQSANLAWRTAQKEFASRFGKRIVKIEFLDSANLIDIHIDTEDEQLRNFVANRSYLVHNSEHTPILVVDEVDVVPKQNQPAYEEAKSIPAARDGMEPITLLTSTRKFAFGNVQREIDAADKSGLKVRHWNLIDVTQRCPPSRHLPDKPKIPIYVDRNNFSALSKADYEKLSEENQKKYTLDKGYAGCLKNCKLFAMCRGHLATKQREHPVNSRGNLIGTPPPMLKSFRYTTNKFRELTLDMARAQLMCWQASREGLIYSNFDPLKHVITPAEAAKKMTGEDYPETFSYDALLELMKGRDGKWTSGIDHGYTHQFSVNLSFVDHKRAFVVGSWSESELDPSEKMALLERTIRPFDPSIYPDTSDPGCNVMFKKARFRIKEWKKGPGSVRAGIETVRYKLMPGLGQPPELYFIIGSPGIPELVECVKLYHWALDDAGRPGDEPDEHITKTADGVLVLDDSVDALRYNIMNVFAKTGRLLAAKEDMKAPGPAQLVKQHERRASEEKAWAQQMLDQAFGYGTDEYSDAFTYKPEVQPQKVKKGRFIFDPG